MFTQISAVSIPGWEPFRNSGFGNRCVICGSYFDEGGICNNGHQQDRVYYRLPEKKPEPEETRARQVKEAVKKICQVFSGCRCTICGGFFADGDDICAGGHEIGKKYAV